MESGKLPKVVCSSQEGMFVFKARKVQVKSKEDERIKKQLKARQHNRT